MKILLYFLIIAMWSNNAFAAVGCDLNDPDRDVKRFFPDSTSYRTEYLSVDKVGGEKLYQQIQQQLGDELNGIYEKIDVPYTVYTILKDSEPIGYIHGVNQKGKYGGIQVFLIMSTDGKIKNFYFQKLTSKNAKELRSKSFGEQFTGLSLSDFKDYDAKNKIIPLNSKLSDIKNPAKESEEDFFATLRGAKKNLILMDSFIFNKQSFKQ